MCMKHGRSIGYIVQKISDAIQGKYNPHYTTDDKDLSILVLKLGGPALLEILHRAKAFPGTSTAYGFLRSKKQKITCPPDASVMTAFSNIELPDSTVQGLKSIPFISIKMDSTYGDQRVRWNPLDNKIYGLCYEHCPRMCENSVFIPAIIWPTCSHKNEEQQKDIIESAILACKTNFDEEPLNLCTDGDPNRRRIFASMMCHDGCKDPRLQKYLPTMPLFDNDVGMFSMTSNFDAKHIAKRFRNAVISEKKSFRKSRTIMKSDLKDVFNSVEDETVAVANNVTALLNPNDKQNVPYASKLLTAVYKFSLKHKAPSFRLQQVTAELVLLGHVYNGVLSMYCYTQKSIALILEDISVSLHILLIIWRTSGSSCIPGQLYNDFVETCRDIYITAMKYKEVCPDKPLYLTLVGTDALENFFKLSRATHNCNTMDCRELINRSQWLHVIDDVFQRHPEWAAKNYGGKRLATTTKMDYSNPKEWNKDLLILKDVDITECWVKGRHRAALILLESKQFKPDEVDFQSIANEGSSILKPKKSRVGVSDAVSW